MIFKDIFDKFEEYLAAFLMAFMACLAFANILSRYLFHYSISFSQELVLNFFVWATFLGTSIAFKRGGHVMVTLLVNKFPKKMRYLTSVFSLLLSVGLFGLLIYCAIDQIRDEIDLWSTSDALNLPVFLYTLGIPVFSTLIIIRIWQAFRRDQNRGE